MEEEQKFKRTQFIVDRAYQFGFFLRLISVLVAVAVCGLVVSAVILWVNIYDPNLPDQTTLVNALLSATLTLSVEIIIGLPLVYYFGIRQTHRVVGPIKRIQASLEAIGQGQFSTRIKLRKGDVLIELAESINRMAEQLESTQPKNPSV